MNYKLIWTPKSHKLTSHKISHRHLPWHESFLPKSHKEKFKLIKINDWLWAKVVFENHKIYHFDIQRKASLDKWPKIRRWLNSERDLWNYDYAPHWCHSIGATARTLDCQWLAHQLLAASLVSVGSRAKAHPNQRPIQTSPGNPRFSRASRLALKIILSSWP